MEPAPRSGPLGEATFDQRLRLEDLVDRDALGEMLRSFHALFGIPLRIYSSDNALLADAQKEDDLCAYANTFLKGRAACGKTVGEVKSLDPGATGDVTHPCFTGATYRVIALEYDGRRIGKLILGPYMAATVTEVPRSLLVIDPAIDPERSRALLAKMARAKPDTVTRIAAHLKASLDLILFSGHKAHLTSAMHLASVRESYRELEEKNGKLQEAYDRLKELDRLKSNFLATVSHELRTPLTSIIGYSEMLVEGIGGELQGEQLDFVRTIHEKGDQLLQLIMSLLDLSKLESGTMSMRRRPTQIEAVLHEVLSTVTPLARKRNVKVELEADGKLAELRADPERLRQVFLNLVDNAIKFTPGGGTVTMRARNVEPGVGTQDAEDGFALLAPAPASVEVRVIDTGIGIPVKERQKVFDPFYQVDSSSTREYGGTGLGLSIVKRIVGAHGGAIAIEDNVPAGRGTVVVVTLPSASLGAPLTRAEPPRAR